MTNQKKPEPNPIEKAIGERAKDPKAQEKFTKEYQTEPTPETNSPRTLRDVPDQPLNQNEMASLEELNRQTEERLQDQYPEETTVIHTVPKAPIIPQPKTTEQVLAETIPVPVLKSDRLSVTETSSQESPPQVIDEIDEYQDVVKTDTTQKTPRKPGDATLDVVAPQKHIERYNKTAEKIGIPKITVPPPAEDIEFTNLKKYILVDGFVVSTVAFHIVALCAEPMMTPSTTMWDFADRAKIPDMVFALLKQPGYLEGIWPSLRIVMSSNKGNSAWSAGIATTIAFFDCIRTLPALKEMKNEIEKKS